MFTEAGIVEDGPIRVQWSHLSRRDGHGVGRQGYVAWSPDPVTRTGSPLTPAISDRARRIRTRSAVRPVPVVDVAPIAAAS